MSSLGGLLVQQGKLDEAEPLLSKVLKGRRGMSDTKPRDVRVSIFALAELLLERGGEADLDEVEKLAAELIDDRPEDDPWYIKGVWLRDAADFARK